MQIESTTVGPFFTSLKGRTAGATLSLPTNLKTVITSWGSCMCSGSIDWDKAISLGFGWGVSAIFPSIDDIWDSGNSLTTLGDGASYYYTGWYPQEGGDILATAIYPMIKDTVLMVLGPGGLCSGSCVGAVSATLSAAADPGVLQSVLDNLAQVSFDGGGVSFGDGSDGLISGGLTVPPTLGASVGAIASCVCGGVASGAPLIDWRPLHDDRVVHLPDSSATRRTRTTRRRASSRPPPSAISSRKTRWGRGTASWSRSSIRSLVTTTSCARGRARAYGSTCSPT